MDRTRWLKVGLAAAAGLLALAAGCSDGDTTVLVDYDHDEFATQFIGFFPERVQAHPGDAITFRQSWTGEPHTVTFGTAVEDVLQVTQPLIEEYGDRPEDEVPPDVMQAYMQAEGTLPTFYLPEPEEEAAANGDEPVAAEGAAEPADQEAAAGAEEGDAEATDDGAEQSDPAAADGDSESAEDLPIETMNQTMAQPCLVRDGKLPQDGRPCEEQDLPPFDGTPEYYNSGIIPYEGPGGNVFELELSDDIEPGEYAFYCAVHGSFQSGVVEVVPPDEPLPSPGEAARELQVQINRMVKPYDQTFRRALEGDYTYRGEEYDWNYAGLLLDEDQGAGGGIINEFVPKDVSAKVGEPVVWRMFGPHSISFDVPEYFPIVEFDDDGTVRSNEALYPAAGGAPEVPEPEDPSEPLTVDGGTYDGSGFWSSGVLWSEAYVEYTLRFSKPGEYPVACLIHPPMVGTVRVTE